MAIDRKKLLQRAETAMRESKHVDFKSEFDLSSPQAWCELIKDMVACSNSGGGVIIFGVADDGTNTAFDPAPLLAYDTADIANKIAKYIGGQLADLEMVDIKRKAKSRVALVIPGTTEVPIIFTNPGTYDLGGGKQKTAFSKGTIYFRHGSKSEPGTRDDLLDWRDREIARVRKSWMGGIRKVAQAGTGETITVVSSKSPSAVVRAQISTDPAAAPITPTNADEIWPHRQKELLAEVNKRLGKGHKINSHDILCIKNKFDVLANPKFACKPHKMSAPQYSVEFVDWMVGEYQKDQDFFAKLRAASRPKAK